MSDRIRCPSAAELLGVWESGLGRTGSERALLLLECACAETPVEELAGWSIGRRDAALFRLRRMLFGERLHSVARCPECGAEVEISFRLSDLECDDAGPGAGMLRLPDREIHFRAPDSRDLAAVETEPDVTAARDRLLERCIVRIDPEAAGELTGPVREQLAARIGEADAMADRRLQVICGECGRRWEEIFDIAAWLGREIGGWVRRMVREVHALACAYGWRESDILAMNPTRRQLYLNLLAQG